MSTVRKKSLLRSEEALYKDWLIRLISRSEEDEKYRPMLNRLWVKNFYTIEDDENRCGDGLDLRLQYYNDVRGPLNNLEELGPCRVLEVLIGIAKRCAFEVYFMPKSKNEDGFFWELLDNLQLTIYSSDNWGRNAFLEIDDILTNWMDRTYSRSGWGGIFPLNNPRKDQRKTSIWYQMHAYLGEIYFDT